MSFVKICFNDCVCGTRIALRELIRYSDRVLRTVHALEFPAYSGLLKAIAGSGATQISESHPVSDSCKKY